MADLNGPALRGSVHDAYLPFGEHPVVVLSQTRFNSRLNHVVVLVVTGTPGPAATHIPLGPEAGLTRYDVSYCDITSIQPIDRYDLLDWRGIASPAELRHVEEALLAYLGF